MKTEPTFNLTRDDLLTLAYLLQYKTALTLQGGGAGWEGDGTMMISVSVGGKLPRMYRGALADAIMVLCFE
jgi:hypothetical protein